MTQAVLVSRLAMRELWISFRLLLILAAYALPGVVVALVPAPLPTALAWLAVGLAAAGTAGAAVASWSLSRERALGRAAWLATRAIPRATILIGWFVTLAAISAVGVLGAGMLGWLAMSPTGARVDLPTFVAVLSSVAAGSLALVALGLTLGAALPPPAATLLTGGISLTLLVLAWVAMPGFDAPTESVARLPQLAAPISVAVRGAGACLAATAILLLVARVAWERVDL